MADTSVGRNVSEQEISFLMLLNLLERNLSDQIQFL